MKLFEFLFPLPNPEQNKILYVTDSAGGHEHAQALDAFRSLNCPLVLLRRATSEAAVPDHSTIHKSIKCLTRRKQKFRRLIAWRKAKRTLSRSDFLK